jgi:hypothetical protein
LATDRHQNNRIDSSEDVLGFVQGLLNRYEVLFDKVIFLRPLKRLAHELDQASPSQYCQFQQSSVGKCYVIISENLLREAESGDKWFLKGVPYLPGWKSPMAFYLLVEIAHHKHVPWSNNRCEQWALNELCSANNIYYLES